MHPLEIAFREVLPNALPPVLALSSVIVAGAVLTEAALSFLGLGDPNRVTWGGMIAEGRAVLRSAPYLSIIPGIALVLSVLGVYLAGEGLVEATSRRRSRVSRSLEVSDLSVAYRRDGRAGRPESVDLDGRARRTPRRHRRKRLGQEHAGAAPSPACCRRPRAVRRRIALAVARPPARPGKRYRLRLPGSVGEPRPGADCGRAGRRGGARASRRRLDATALTAAAELLDQGAPARSTRGAEAFPHQLSGGQKQRVAIAAAIAADPALLIADEPTSALDTIVQAEIVALIDGIVAKSGMALLFITHDIALAARHRRPHRRVPRRGCWSRPAPASRVMGSPARSLYARWSMRAGHRAAGRSARQRVPQRTPA